VATIRKVPEIYPTIQAAHDAAAAGDTVLISPGTYAPVKMTKPIHLIGDTLDPVGNPVQIGNGTNTPGLACTGIYINIPAQSVATDMLVEGIKFANSSNSGWNTIQVSPSWPTKLRMRINRCLFSHADYGACIFAGNSSSTGSVELRVEYCTVTNLRNGIGTWWSGPSLAGNMVDVLRTQTVKSLVIPNTSGWASALCDQVLVATANYGANYGQFLRPQYEGVAYTIPGQIVLPDGIDRSTTRVRLYREIGGQIEVLPWVLTVPDPVTGEWVFRYLPTDQRFWVQTVPPQGYRPRIDGPYVPAPA
jgi:hypothetical protein